MKRNIYVSRNQLLNNDLTIYHAIFLQYVMANRRVNQSPFNSKFISPLLLRSISSKKIWVALINDPFNEITYVKYYSNIRREKCLRRKGAYPYPALNLPVFLKKEILLAP